MEMAIAEGVFQQDIDDFCEKHQLKRDDDIELKRIYFTKNGKRVTNFEGMF